MACGQKNSTHFKTINTEKFYTKNFEMIRIVLVTSILKILSKILHDIIAKSSSTGGLVVTPKNHALSCEARSKPSLILELEVRGLFLVSEHHVSCSGNGFSWYAAIIETLYQIFSFLRWYLHLFVKTKEERKRKSLWEHFIFILSAWKTDLNNKVAFTFL